MAENRSDEHPGDDWDAATDAPVTREPRPDAPRAASTAEPHRADIPVSREAHPDAPRGELDPSRPGSSDPSRSSDPGRPGPTEPHRADAGLWDDEPADPTPTRAAGDDWSANRGFASPDAAVTAEHDRLVAERAARRQQRLDALAPKPEPEPTPAPSAPVGTFRGGAAQPTVAARTETVQVVQRSTDKWAGSLGLFLLRLVVAAIMGVHGANKLLNLPATTEMLQSTIIPAPGVMAIVIGAAEIAIAIALVFGLLTRFAGLGVALVAGGALAFVQWGPWSPFRPGEAGFNGELELLLVAVGILFLLVGGGGWSIDRGFRSRRAAD